MYCRLSRADHSVQEFGNQKVRVRGIRKDPQDGCGSACRGLCRAVCRLSGRARHGAVKRQAGRPCKPVCITLCAPRCGAPRHPSLPFWQGAGQTGNPQGRMQGIEHLSTGAVSWGKTRLSSRVRSLPIPAGGSSYLTVLPDGNAVAWACLQMLPLRGGRSQRTQDAFARLQALPVLPAPLTARRLSLD